jgi:hypothetical protein
MNGQRVGARAQYRAQEGQRVRESLPLAETFRELKSLTVELEHYTPGGRTRTSQVKYEVNLAHAKSVFRFLCPNSECIRGDFDLTDELAAAVAQRRTTVAGEQICAGWRSKTAVDKHHCQNVLRYHLTLRY